MYLIGPHTVLVDDVTLHQTVGLLVWRGAGPSTNVGLNMDQLKSPSSPTQTRTWRLSWRSSNITQTRLAGPGSDVAWLTFCLWPWISVESSRDCSVCLMMGWWRSQWHSSTTRFKVEAKQNSSQTHSEHELWICSQRLPRWTLMWRRWRTNWSWTDEDGRNDVQLNCLTRRGWWSDRMIDHWKDQTGGRWCFNFRKLNCSQFVEWWRLKHSAATSLSELYWLHFLHFVELSSLKLETENETSHTMVKLLNTDKIMETIKSTDFCNYLHNWTILT